MRIRPGVDQRGTGVVKMSSIEVSGQARTVSRTASDSSGASRSSRSWSALSPCARSAFNPPLGMSRPARTLSGRVGMNSPCSPARMRMRQVWPSHCPGNGSRGQMTSRSNGSFS
ncbi:hypothetical protein BIV25_16655 [Streptomyces sp. MUSC 14]|nr:hypothetical protein BIV25_16655 [Streptomyces sp. MUSC 14]